MATAAATPLIPGIGEGGEVAAAGAPPAISAMAAAPPPPSPAQGDGDLPVRSSASPSIPPPPPPSVFNGVGRMGGQEDEHSGDPQMGTDGSVDPQMGMGNLRKRTNSKVQVGEGAIHTESIQQDYQNESTKPRSKKSRNSKLGVQDNVKGGDPQMAADRGGMKRQQCTNLVVERKQRKKIISKLPIGSKSATPPPRSPMLTSSPGVNMLIRSAALKRAKIAGSPEQSPSCTQLGSPSLQDLSPGRRTTNSHGSERRRRKLISAIWREAVPIYKEGKLVEGKCIHCHQIFPASRDSGTSHIKRHLKVCEAKTEMNEMVNKMGRPEGIDPNWKFNPKGARRKLVKLIVVNEMPFSLVEYAPFREFTASLNPWFEKLSRATIKNECLAAFKDFGNAMKEYFDDCDSRISLTGDMWTSNQKLGYFCITCHFVSNEWVLHKRVIRFSMLETPHSSLNMFNIVLDSIQEWNLESKLFSFTMDNASVNTAMVNLLRENLKNKGLLLLEGKLLHFRCATHVFNIIVQDGLREIKTVVNNIRESVKYVRSSQTRIEKFLGIIIQEGLSSRYRRPSVDVSTRWNSTYLMLEAALPLRNAFGSLENQDTDYKFAPLISEWRMAEAVCKLLEVFYTATVTLSGSKYPTSHLYFYQLWNIKKMLNKEESSLNRKILNREASSQDNTIARMVKLMQNKFNQYWKETYKSACIPVILDPRFKYDFLEFLLRDFGGVEESRTWMGEVKNTMQELFNEYSKEVSVQSHRESDTEEVEDNDDPLAEWDQFIRSKRRQSSNELDQYLKEELTPRKEEVDILQWWKTNSSKYPVLSKMARDILAIPASTVPSESAFSTGGRVISDYRSSLACSTVEALICLQDWFKAADALDNE